MENSFCGYRRRQGNGVKSLFGNTPRLTPPPLMIKRKAIIIIQKSIIAAHKKGVTEEGIYMSDESKKKAGGIDGLYRLFVLKLDLYVSLFNRIGNNHQN